MSTAAPVRIESALLVRTLAVVAVGAFGFVGYLLVASPVQHARTQAVLRAQLSEELVGQTTPTGGEIEPGRPVAVLSVPRLGLDEVVVEGTTGAQLADGAGHRRASPLPGQPGTSVVLGRAQLFGGPFRRVPTLRPGDELRATTGQGVFTYRVDGARRADDPTPPALQSNDGRLTLVTVEGGGWLGRNRTVFVDATLTSPARAAPGTRTRVQLAAEAPLARDDSRIVGVVLWLQALVVVAAAVTWSWLRWGRRETLIVGTPVLLVAGFQLCWSTAIALLPNLM